MKHAVLIRFSYPPGDPRVDWRFGWFRDEVLPRLLAQTVQDFEIWVLCQAHDADRLAALNPRVTPQVGGCPWETLDIQTRHDSDDLVEPGYVQRIRDECAKEPDRRKVISFQPWKLQLPKRRRFTMRQRYGRFACSMFSSLYRPNPADRASIYSWTHLQLWKAAKRVVTVPEGYCYLVVHGKNMSTRISRGDRRL